jgi:hypothetical protein
MSNGIGRNPASIWVVLARGLENDAASIVQ